MSETSKNTSADFDDVLARTGNEQSALARGVQLAEARATEEAPESFCEWCIYSTPLALDNAGDVGTVRFMDGLERAVRDRIVELDGRDAADIAPDEEALGFTDLWWIRDELTEVYREAYFDACADPADCEVCANPDGYGECGHERLGEPCPTRVRPGGGGDA